MKKIVIGIVFMITGLGFAVYTEHFFRDFIQDLFRWTTDNHITFHGKNFFIFSKPYYYITFSISALLFGIANKTKSFSKILINAMVLLLIFGSVLSLISAIDANAKVLTCTACYDGIFSIHYNDINYSLILTISVLTAIIPSIVTMIKARKNRPHRS